MEVLSINEGWGAGEGGSLLIKKKKKRQRAWINIFFQEEYTDAQ